MTVTLAETLNVHIIGAGMGGLGAALALARQGFKQINVWESASSLGEVGAGINITPNLSRILTSWDVYDYVEPEGVPLKSASVINCSTDEPLTHVDYSYIEREYGWPFLEVHRAALQQCLIKGVERSGVVKVHLNHSVKEWDVDRTRFLVADRQTAEGSEAAKGTWVQADVLLAADGIKSRARSAFLKRRGEVDRIVDTGQAAYRILVKKDDVRGDPELLPLFEDAHSYRWIGEKRHIIAYPICAGTVFNMSSAHPDTHFTDDDQAWTTSGSRADMLRTFADFCPRVQKLLRLVPEGEILEWKLRVHEPIAQWVDGHVALVGDACHPTLPHLAQGAAQAIEDAAVLGVVLGKVRSKADVPAALRVYQALRKPRADWAVIEAAANGKGLHLAAGKDREARDKMFAAANRAGGANPDKQIDKATQQILYSYDCAKEADEQYDELFKQLQREGGDEAAAAS